MTINVNNKQQEINNATSLRELLDINGISLRGIAIAINDIVIIKEEWNSVFLKEEDTVTIIQATQGG